MPCPLPSPALRTHPTHPVRLPYPHIRTDAHCRPGQGCVRGTEGAVQGARLRVQGKPGPQRGLGKLMQQCLHALMHGVRAWGVSPAAAACGPTPLADIPHPQFTRSAPPCPAPQVLKNLHPKTHPMTQLCQAVLALQVRRRGGSGALCTGMRVRQCGAGWGWRLTCVAAAAASGLMPSHAPACCFASCSCCVPGGEQVCRGLPLRHPQVQVRGWGAGRGAVQSGRACTLAPPWAPLHGRPTRHPTRRPYLAAAAHPS